MKTNYLFNLVENLDFDNWMKENFPNIIKYGYQHKIENYVDDCIFNILADGEVELSEVYDGDFFATVLGMTDKMLYFGYDLDFDVHLMFDGINEDAYEANFDQFLAEARKVKEGMLKHFGLNKDLLNSLSCSPGEQLAELKEQVEDRLNDEDTLEIMFNSAQEYNSIQILGREYYAAEILKAIDNTKYREAINKIVDNLIESYLR